MKQYVIDEIRPADHAKLKAHLDTHYPVSRFEGLYHLPLDEALLNEQQKDHHQCGPHYFALELLPDRLNCELLVRSSQRIRCDCIQYADNAQQQWLMGVVDAFFDDLNIMT